MTFHAFVTRYLDDMRQTQRRSNKTIEAYARDLQQAIGFFGEDAKIQSLDTLSVIGWVRSLSAQRIAGRSIGRKLSALRGVFQEAITQGLIKVNPAVDVRPPKTGKHLPNALSPDAMQRLLDFPINPNDIEAIRDQAVYELLYSSGLRLAEVLGLTVKDVHGNPEEIRVSGKGNKERIVPVGCKAREALSQWLKQRPEWDHGHTEQAFITKRGLGVSPRTDSAASQPSRASSWTRPTCASSCTKTFGCNTSSRVLRRSSCNSGVSGPSKSFDNTNLHSP